MKNLQHCGWGMLLALVATSIATSAEMWTEERKRLCRIQERLEGLGWEPGPAPAT
jgi:hypothetical protein